MSMLTDEDDVSLEAEIETLKSIYINELQVDVNNNGIPEVITVHLYPATADDAEKQYVRLTLILKLKEKYPFEVPEVKIKNPRGLSDSHINRIFTDIQKKAEERKGGPMLYELIEVAKEHLTRENTPSCQCVICLYGFTDDDVFTKTDCYHYFHSHCLARYISHSLQQIEELKNSQNKAALKEVVELQVVCPVCRSPISNRVQEEDFPPPRLSETQTDFVATSETKAFGRKMRALYLKQKAKGGIIDLEAERKRFLIEISSARENTRQRNKDEKSSVGSAAEGDDTDIIQDKEKFNQIRSNAQHDNRVSPSLREKKTNFRSHRNKHSRYSKTKVASEEQDSPTKVNDGSKLCDLSNVSVNVETHSEENGHSEEVRTNHSCFDNDDNPNLNRASYSSNERRSYNHNRNVRQKRYPSSLPNGNKSDELNITARRFKSNHRIPSNSNNHYWAGAHDDQTHRDGTKPCSATSNLEKSINERPPNSFRNRNQNQDRYQRSSSNRGRRNYHEKHSEGQQYAEPLRNLGEHNKGFRDRNITPSPRYKSNNLSSSSNSRAGLPRFSEKNSGDERADLSQNLENQESKQDKLEALQKRSEIRKDPFRRLLKTDERESREVGRETDERENSDKRIGPPPGFCTNPLTSRNNAFGRGPPPGFPTR